MSFEIDIIAETDYWKSFRGPKIHSNVDLHTINTSIRNLSCDLLVVPGRIETMCEYNSDNMVQNIRKLIESIKRVMMVCSGSAFLAKTGLMDGIVAPTNKTSISLLKGYGPKLKWVGDARWVEDGKF